MLCIIILTGCGNNKQNQDSVNEVLNPSDMVYNCEILDISGYYGKINIYKYRNNRLYFVTDIMDDNSEGYITQKMYSVKLDGTGLQEIPIEFTKDEYIKDFDLKKESFVFNICKYDGIESDGDLNVVEHTIIVCDNNGNKKHSFNLDAVLEDDEIYYITITPDKMIVGSGYYFLYVFDESLNYKNKIKPDKIDEIRGDIIFDAKGEIICCGSNERDIDIGFSYIELEKMSSDIINGVSVPSSIVTILPGFGKYDFCYLDMGSLYGYEIEKKTKTGIMDFMRSDITWAEAMDFIVLEDGRFIGTIKDNKTGEKSFILCTKKEDLNQDDRIEISYGTIGIEDDIYSAIREFNNSSDKYHITIKDYMNEEDPVTKLNLDIASGNVPDIIDLAVCNADEYISKGLVDDLTSYIDEDKDINVSDFIPSVLGAIKKDGKIYYIAPNFLVSTLVGSTSNVGMEKGWTFEDFKKVIKESPEGVRPFLSDNRIDVFASLIDAGESDYIDWKAGKCTFDSDDYRDILYLSKTLGVDEEYDYEDVDESEIMEGRVLFQTGFVDMSGIQLCDLLYDGKYNCVGYPNKEKNGSFFFFPVQVGIYSKSENKEGAWEFLRTLLSKEYQGLTMSDNNMPTRQDCFDLMLEGAMAEKSYVNELGKEIAPRDYEVPVGNKTIKLGPITQEQADMYSKLINKTSKVGYFDDAVTDILLEEAQDYFSGKNNLDKAVANTQNRVNIYINEKK